MYSGETLGAPAQNAPVVEASAPAPEVADPAPTAPAGSAPVATAPITSAPKPAEQQGAHQRSVTAPVLNEIEGIIAAEEPDLTFGPETMSQGAASAPAPQLSDTLRAVPIAYEVPSSATFGKPFEVALAIDGTGADAAVSVLPGDERILEGTAQVADRARASLVGSAFEVEALSPDTQVISSSMQNRWLWRVVPTEAGEHDLVIELFAVENGEALPVRTFNDTVTVSVSRFRQAISLANEANPIVMVLGGIGSALAGLFGVVRFFRSGS